MLLVTDVVFDEKPQSDGSIGTDGAGTREAVFGDAIDDGEQDVVFDVPPLDERGPGQFGVAVGRNPGFLRVEGASVGAVDGGAHESLAVVGGGVEQVADDLLAGPASGTPGDIGEAGWNSGELGAEAFDLLAKGECCGCRQKRTPDAGRTETGAAPKDGAAKGLMESKNWPAGYFFNSESS